MTDEEKPQIDMELVRKSAAIRGRRTFHVKTGALSDALRQWTR
jgi:hypothetical protein